MTNQNNSLSTTLLEWLDIGGPVVIILLIMSVISLSIIIFKTLQFYTSGIGNTKDVNQAIELIRNNDINSAAILLQKKPQLASSIISYTLETQNKRLNNDMVREEVARVAINKIELLRNHLRILEVIASTAPLLGLFGTVIGMIIAFQQLESSASQVNPALLSGGIWQALLTTAVGLAVAMPTAVSVNIFEQRIERFSHNLNNWITQLFTMDCQRIDNDPALTAVDDSL